MDKVPAMKADDGSDMIVCKKYELLGEIGNGGFGDIYVGRNCVTKEVVAVKIERKCELHSHLCHEAKIFQHLYGGVGIPRPINFHRDKDSKTLVMELLGPSLEDLLSFCSRQFTLKTTLMLADQMIERLEFIHSKGYIHRDLKPENFVMGVKHLKHQVYLIDFGLAKQFYNPKTKTYIPQCKGKSFIGTAYYASKNAHMGVEQSPRDDMEALGYLLVYFLRGNLPWKGIKGGNKQQRREKIFEMKMSTPISILCAGLPYEFSCYLNVVKLLSYQEKVNYSYLRRLFSKCLNRYNLQNDYKYDWVETLNTKKVESEEEGEEDEEKQKEN